MSLSIVGANTSQAVSGIEHVHDIHDVLHYIRDMQYVQYIHDTNYIHYSTIQHNTILYTTIHCSTLCYKTLHCTTGLHSTIHCSTYSTLQCHTALVHLSFWDPRQVGSAADAVVVEPRGLQRHRSDRSEPEQKGLGAFRGWGSIRAGVESMASRV